MFFRVTSLYILVTIFTTYVSALRVVCYYESWATYNNRNPENIDVSLCSHLNYAFIELHENGTLKLADPDLEVDQGFLKRVTDLKKVNTNLKVLLSVGGADENLFSKVAADENKVKAFVNSAVHYITTYNFDGLDVDWEVPSSDDKENFINLLTKLKTAFTSHKWLLTAAVTANPSNGYDVGELNNLLDWYNVMTYDYYGTWSDYTGQNSALYAASIESSYEKSHLNMKSCSNNWLKAGAHKNMLVLGTAFYGRNFVLTNTSKHGLHAPIEKGKGGSIDYYKICSGQYKNWTRVWDDEQKNPYKHHQLGWLGYDDKESILEKGEFIKDNGFAGGMMWSVEMDDLNGKCGEKHILLKTLNKGLGNTF